MRHSWEFPFFRHELRDMLRTRRAFWLLVSSVAISGFLVTVAFAFYFHTYNSEDNLAIFFLFAQGQLFCGLLVIPAFTAGSIAGERERNTYDLLYSTLLSPVEIALSKAACAGAYMLLLLLASAPLATLIVLLGGITFGSVLKVYAVTAVAIMTSGLVCLVVSVRSKRTASATTRAVFWVFFWNFGLALGFLLLGKFTMGIAPPMVDPILPSCLSPSFAIDSILLRPSVFPTDRPWLIYIAFSGAIAVAHLAYLLVRVRTPDVAPAPTGRNRAAETGSTAARPWTVRLIIRLARANWPFVSNTVFVKEIMTEVCGRRRLRRVVFWISLVVFATMAGTGIVSGDEPWPSVMAMSVTATVGMSILVPAASAGCFSGEREKQTFDLLRTTMLTSNRVASGKVLASFFSGGGIWAAAVLVTPFLASSLLEALHLAFAVGVTLAHVLLMVSLVTTAVSASCRRTVTALIVSYVVVGAVSIFLPFLHPLCTLAFFTVLTETPELSLVLIIYMALNFAELAMFWSIALSRANRSMPEGYAPDWQSGTGWQYVPDQTRGADHARAPSPPGNAGSPSD